MLDKYKVNDTSLIINYGDGYNYKFNMPVFNFAVPIGVQGLIFPNFDLFDFKDDFCKKSNNF